MTAGLDHPLVADYLRRLDDAARVLGPSRRAELVSEIQSHLRERLRESGGDEAEVRNMLQRMGSAEEIVAEADDRPIAYQPPTHPPVQAPRRNGIWLELAAVLLMTVGSLVPLIGWLAGVVLLWMSGWLRWWEKVIATLVVPGGIGGLAIIGLMTARVCSVDENGLDSCAATSWWDQASPWLFGAAAIGSLLIPLVLLGVARTRSLRPAA